MKSCSYIRRKIVRSKQTLICANLRLKHDHYWGKMIFCNWGVVIRYKKFWLPTLGHAFKQQIKNSNNNNMCNSDNVLDNNLWHKY